MSETGAQFANEHQLLLLLLLLLLLNWLLLLHQPPQHIKGKCEHSKSGGNDFGKRRQHWREGTDSTVRSRNGHL